MELEWLEIIAWAIVSSSIVFTLLIAVLKVTPTDYSRPERTEFAKSVRHPEPTFERQVTHQRRNTEEFRQRLSEERSFWA